MSYTINEVKMFLTQNDELYERGLYRVLLDAAEDRFGDFQLWEEPLLSRLASRCLGHLGLDRTAYAIIFRAWRRHPNHPDLAASYLRVVIHRRGELIAWEISKQLLTLDLTDEQRADVLVEQASILSTFRDYALAEKTIKQAGDLSKDIWVKYNQGYLLFCQDRYEDSKGILKSVLLEKPDYRPSRQMLAHLLQLQGNHDQAIEQLQDLAKTMQSVSMLSQLLYLYIEVEAYSKAWDCMDKIELYYYKKPKYAIRQINYIKADLLCSQQRYEEALPYFEAKNFYHSRIAESIRTNADASERRVLDVPFVRQHHMTCAPASMTAVAGYWGVTLDQAEVVKAICYDGTPDVDERNWIESQGWAAIEFELKFKTLKQLIDLNMPVMLATVEPGSAHLQVIVGYDNKLGVYILRDPYNPRLQEMLVAESHQYYASSGPRCLLMLPITKLDEIGHIHFEAVKLYDEQYRLNRALDKNDRQLAYNAYRSMLQISAEHRLTLRAQRSLAIYDNDEPLTLKVTEKLLERYPDDVNLQLSKVASIAYMGSYRYTLEYLEKLCEKPMTDFLVKSRYVRELAGDQRQQKRTEKLLRRLLALRATDASTLKIYADNLWAIGEYKTSYEIYRFITCLEDKVEEYASAYFQAARYFKETEKALNFLIDRFDRFIQYSSGPAISLFNAFDNLNRPLEGLEYLEKAISIRSDEGYLILFTARQYYHTSQMERCTQLMEKALPIANRIRYAELAAEVSEFQGRQREAIEHWQTILAYEPLNQTANRSFVRLMHEGGKEQSASEYIRKQLKEFPGNYDLLRLQIHWCDEGELQLLEKYYRELIECHPDDNWAYKALSRMLLQSYRLNNALELAQESVKLGSHDADAYCCLGEVFEGMTKYPQAIEAFRSSIHLSCDATDAFESLLRCATSKKNKKEQLQFIYDELMSQVTFGDGLLEFQQIARSWSTTEELLKFLEFAISQRPDLWQSWVALSVEKRELGIFDEAHKAIDKGINKFPLIPRLYLEKAEILYYEHKLGEAEQYLKKVLELSPGWSRALTRLSDVLEYQNKNTEAIELLQQAISKSPYTVTPYGYLADLLWRSGDKQKAIETLMKVVDISPLYSWAWDRLKEMSSELGQVDRVIDRIGVQREKMPDNNELVRIHVKLLDDLEKKRTLLDNYLKRHPTAIGPSIEFVHALCDLGDYPSALAICSKDRWGENIPIAIRANHAWIQHTMGEMNDAIVSMNQVVDSDPNYYDGWRFLANWYDELGDSEHVLQCVNECQRLYPNNANVLCFVAEHLQKHAEGDRENASDLLQKAFYLDPTDRYNGLLYIDDLLARKHYEQADDALLTLKRYVYDAYVISRELSHACKVCSLESAMQFWHLLITQADVNEDLILYAWEQIGDAGMQSSACLVIERQRNLDLESGENLLSEYCGEYWVGCQINDKGEGEVVKTLRATSARDGFDDRIFEGLLRSLINKETGVPKLFIKKHYLRLQKDTTNWGLVAYLYAINAKWHEVVNWLKDAKDRADVNAWTLYFYGLAFRQITKWDTGVSITKYALELPRDSYYDELLIWHVFDLYINGDATISREQLYNDINLKDLSGLSKFILGLNESLMCLKGRGFVEAYRDISPILRQCQRDFQDISGHVAANIARQKTRDLLENSIQGSFLDKFFWKWRLSNHF